MCKICTVVPATSYCFPIVMFPQINIFLDAGDTQVVTSYDIPRGNIIYSIYHTYHIV